MAGSNDFDMDALQEALGIYPANDMKCFTIRGHGPCGPTTAMIYMAEAMLKACVRAKVREARGPKPKEERATPSAFDTDMAEADFADFVELAKAALAAERAWYGFPGTGQAWLVPHFFRLRKALEGIFGQDLLEQSD